MLNFVNSGKANLIELLFFYSGCKLYSESVNEFSLVKILVEKRQSMFGIEEILSFYWIADIQTNA